MFINRPGSIQTTAQEKFVYSFEHAYQHILNVYPLLDKENGVIHQKTLSQSIKDSQYSLTLQELKGERYRNVHKIVSHASKALELLADHQPMLACLAVTGLSKLAPKADYSITGGSVENIRSRAAKMEGSYLVTMNSISEGTEEVIMKDIKEQINSNSWDRFLSVCEVAQANISLVKDESMEQQNQSNLIDMAEDKHEDGTSITGSRRSSRSITDDNGLIALGMRRQTSSLKLKSSSYRQFTETDFNRSKKVSSNLCAQLLLDFIETRKNPVFEESLIVQLKELWLKKGDDTLVTAIDTLFKGQAKPNQNSIKVELFTAEGEKSNEDLQQNIFYLKNPAEYRESLSAKSKDLFHELLRCIEASMSR